MSSLLQTRSLCLVVFIVLLSSFPTVVRSTTLPEGERFTFVLPDGCRRGDCAWDHVYLEYARWHNETLAKPCDAQAALPLVWSPNAGLGDSLLALLAGLQTAMKTGRLFFVDWTTPFDGWRVGLSLPGVGQWGEKEWNWDWSTYACRDMVSAASDPHTIARVSGSITTKNWALGEVGEMATLWHEAQFPDAHDPHIDHMTREFQDAIPRRYHLAREVLRPSQAVQQALGDLIPVLNTTFVVGLQIRTGSGAFRERRPFLSPGDEQQFFQCYRGLVQHLGLDAGSHKLVLASDTPTVVETARTEFPDAPLVTLDSVVVHTFRRPPTRKGVVDAFADMFMLSFSNVLFATNWSLFGRTAAEIGRSKDVYYIDDTSCGSGNHRDCFGTGLPDVCTLAHDEL